MKSLSQLFSNQKIGKGNSQLYNQSITAKYQQLLKTKYLIREEFLHGEKY
jgi:hypothetical protein